VPEVFFQPEAVFRDRAAEIALVQSARIRTLLPHADVQHIGATSVKGALTKGDVDLVVLVERIDFNRSVAALRSIYEINQAENWTETFASFKDDSSFDLPFGAQLVVAGRDDFFFIRLQQRLSSDHAALEEYNALKRAHHGGDPNVYRQAKGTLIARLLAERRP
jgi:uncharacterized protein